MLWFSALLSIAGNESPKFRFLKLKGLRLANSPTFSSKPRSIYLSAYSMPKLQSGFTLIELMAVMLIVGMVMSLVTVSIGDGNRSRKVQGEVRGLYQGIQLLLEEAVYARRQLGLRFDVDTSEELDQWQYSFLFYDDEARRWHVFETEELRQNTFMHGVELSLEVDGEMMLLGDIEKDNQLFVVADSSKEEERIAPDLYFLSSGETQNFKLLISDKAAETIEYEAKPWRITGNILGQVRYWLPGEEDEDV